MAENVVYPGERVLRIIVSPDGVPRLESEDEWTIAELMQIGQILQQYAGSLKVSFRQMASAPQMQLPKDVKDIKIEENASEKEE